MAGNEPLIPRHGGYRNLKIFQMAQLAFDVTVHFCERCIDKFSRTRDLMTQAARSGVQNIAETDTLKATIKKLKDQLKEQRTKSRTVHALQEKLDMPGTKPKPGITFGIAYARSNRTEKAHEVFNQLIKLDLAWAGLLANELKKD